MKLLNSLHGEDERRSGPKRFAMSLLVYVNILALVFVAGAQAEAMMGDRAEKRG